jgi:hypothetical protein
MKKFGILIFIVAIMVGVVFANLFSFGKASGSFFKFSIGSGVEGSSVAATEVRDASDFETVEVGGALQVEIKAGRDFNVEVQADDNLLQFIKTEVSNGVLKIKTSERINAKTPVRVLVSAPSIEHIDASGASKISLEGASGPSLVIETSGASKVSLAGEVNKLEIDVSGASNIDAENLKAKVANVEASGASKVGVFVTEGISTNASGASKIWYTGNPTSVDNKSTGASSVHHK